MLPRLRYSTIYSYVTPLSPSVPTVVFGHFENRAVGYREKGEVGELICPVLQSGDGRGGQRVGVLRERVQHLAVHVAAHEVLDQLNLTCMV